VGDLGQWNEPTTARLEYWGPWRPYGFTPWKEYYLNSEEEAVVLAYAQRFHFGS
jgi:hypothetical protein